MAQKRKKRLDTENNDGLSLWLVLVDFTHILFMIVASLTGLFPGILFYFFQINLLAINTTRVYDSLYDDAQTLGVAPEAYELSKVAIISRNLLGMAMFGLTIAAYALLFTSPVAGLLFLAAECLWAGYTCIKFFAQAKTYLNDTNKNPYLPTKIESSSFALIHQLGMVAAIACLFFIPGVQFIVLPIIISSMFVLIGTKILENSKLKEIEKKVEEDWLKRVEVVERMNYLKKENECSKTKKYSSDDLSNNASKNSAEHQQVTDKKTLLLEHKNTVAEESISTPSVSCPSFFKRKNSGGEVFTPTTNRKPNT